MHRMLYTFRMKVTTYTDLRRNLAAHLDRVSEDHEPLLVTRTNGAHAIVLSLDDYNALNATEHLLSSKANADWLRKSVEQMRRGETAGVTTLEELDRMAE